MTYYLAAVAVVVFLELPRLTLGAVASCCFLAGDVLFLTLAAGLAASFVSSCWLLERLLTADAGDLDFEVGAAATAAATFLGSFLAVACSVLLC